MERRVHPQNSLEGRITTEDFGLGMITNWGAHHVGIAHWAMGQELGGPLTIDAHAEFMTNDTWTVHTTLIMLKRFIRKTCDPRQPI
jgi:hypothetical protein